MERKNVEIALEYIKSGLRIFPCDSKKAPYCANGFLDASADEAQVRQWWAAYPEAMIGAPNDQFIVLDVDDYDLSAGVGAMVDIVKGRLKDEGIIPEDGGFKVRTMSGGSHYYFQAQDSITRKIGNLAKVDLLGGGGYVILPDQKNYVCETHDAPWASLDALNPFDIEKFNTLVDELHSLTVSAKLLLNAEKNGSNATKKGPKGPSKKTNGYNSDTDQYEKVAQELRSSDDLDLNMGVVDYENDKITFKIRDGIYSATEKEFTKADHTQSFLGDGPLQFESGSLTTELVMELFHNREIQTKLGEYLGLDIPEAGATTSMHSIFPGHHDSNKSMGVRWSKDGSHLIVRDFANHYTDTTNQNDYNMVRLYTVLTYNTNTPRLRGPEFMVWFMRLMHEAGVMDLTANTKAYRQSLEKLTDGQRSVANDMLLLDAIKSMYVGYDEQIVFADKFASAWCSLPPSSVNRHKKALVKKNIISVEGLFDCSAGKREDGFFKTKLYRLNTTEKTLGGLNLNIREAVEIVPSSNAKKAKAEVDARYPELGTLVSLVIEGTHHKIVENFAEDYELENVPEPTNMFVPVLVSDKYEVLDVEQGTTYLMDNFVLDIVEGAAGENVLMAYGVSPPIEKMIEKLKEDYESLIEESESYGFVISSDVYDQQLDLDAMTLAFNKYVNRVPFSEINVRYADEDTILQLIDGWHPEGDE